MRIAISDHVRSIAVLALSGLALVCHADDRTAPDPAALSIKTEPAPQWDALFQTKVGWVGGDAAYSVQLSNGQILWFFGDSLIGAVKGDRRVDCTMVNNAVGVQSGPDSDASISFFTGPEKQGKPTSLFAPIDGKGWCWPQGVVRVGKPVYLVLAQIDRAGDGGAFGFKSVAQWLAVIENPEAPPREWHTDLHKIACASFNSDESRSWGSAFCTAGAFTYIYGYQEKGKGVGSKSLLVARVASENLADISAWQFRSESGWSGNAKAAEPTCPGMAAEFSVTPARGRGGYMLVYTENGLGDRIVSRFADAPDGPWSKPLLIYTSPEMQADKSVFCYSAKEHAWAGGDATLISYCQNTWQFSRLFENQAVYRPKFVRVRLTAAGQ